MGTKEYAPVVELVDTLELGSSVERRAGSSPVRGTNKRCGVTQTRILIDRGCYELNWPVGGMVYTWV